MRSLLPIAASALLLTAGAFADATKVTLTGAEEVPEVTTKAIGIGTIAINPDGSVSGSITTKDIAGVAAHIHLGSKGKNGPPVITLTRTGENVWSVPAGSKLTDEQYASYKAGDLYVNVHSAEHKSGEIRAQLR